MDASQHSCREIGADFCPPASRCGSVVGGGVHGTGGGQGHRGETEPFVVLECTEEAP